MANKHLGWLLVAVGLLLLSGCATREIPPPREDLAQAERAIEQAVAAEATEYAPQTLNEARARLEDARTQMANGNHTVALRAAQQARAAAQAATTEAEAVRAEALTEQSRRGIDALREELALEQQEAEQ